MFDVECKYVALEGYEQAINDNCSCITSRFLPRKFYERYTIFEGFFI